MSLADIPGVSVRSEDRSTLAYSSNSAIALVQAVTERGVINIPTFIGSEIEWYRKLGKPQHPTAEECIHALRGGMALYVNPIHHYTDIADASTLEGTEAVATVISGLEVRAVEVGSGYNGTTVAFASPASQRTDTFDLVVNVPGDLPQTINDVPKVLTTNEVEQLNKKLVNVMFRIVGSGVTSVTLTSVVSVMLAGGAKDISLIEDTDIIGNEISKTGLFAFDKVKEGVHLISMHFQSVAIDAAYVNYGIRTSRSVHLFFGNMSVSNMVDMRNGAGSYTHQPIDTENGTYIAGAIDVPSIARPGTTITLQGAGQYMAALARKDSEGVWLSAAETRFGRFGNEVLGCRIFSDTEKSQLYGSGINFIDNTSQGIKFVGNRSLLRDATKISSKRNVGDLTIWITRWLQALGEQFMFKPNYIDTFKEIYRAALPTIRTLEDKRAIEKDEGKGWLWLGDQDAPNLDSLKYNTKQAVLAGQYEVIFAITPISSMERLSFRIVKTDSITSVSRI